MAAIDRYGIIADVGFAIGPLLAFVAADEAHSFRTLEIRTSQRQRSCCSSGRQHLVN
jgi:hypothetical protein